MVARALGTEGFGQFSFIYVYVSFFEIFVQFGLNSILVRELAQNKAQAARILGNAILLRFALILAALPVALILIRGLGYPLSVRKGVYLACFQLFLTLRPIFDTVFRVNLQMATPLLWNTVRALLNLLLVATVASLHPALSWFIAAYLASSVAGFCGLVAFTRKSIPIDLRFDKKILSHLLHESLPLVASAYLTILYYRIDIVMLSLMKDFAAVGFYGAAIRIAETLTVISGSIFASFFPLLARAFKEDLDAFHRLTHQAFQGLLLIGMPIALGGTLVGRDLIPLFFGADFAPAGWTFVILCWHTFFCFLNGLLANILIGCGRQTVDVGISFCLVIVNIALNLCLIPPYSFHGAALATALTELAGMFAYFTFTLKDPHLKISLPKEELVTALKVNVPFFIFLSGLKFLGTPSLLIVLGGIFAYAILLFLFKLISVNDVKNYLFFLQKPSGELETPSE